MQIKGDAVIEPDALIINPVPAYETKTKCDDSAVLSPDEEAGAFGHPLRDGEKIILRQRFKFEWRSLMDGLIQRVNFVNQRRNLAYDLHLDLGCASGLAEFPAQIFTSRFAECAEIFVPVFVAEREPRHWHARNSAISV